MKTMYFSSLFLALSFLASSVFAHDLDEVQSRDEARDICLKIAQTAKAIAILKDNGEDRESVQARVDFAVEHENMGPIYTHFINVIIKGVYEQDLTPAEAYKREKNGCLAYFHISDE